MKGRARLVVRRASLETSSQSIAFLDETSLGVIDESDRRHGREPEVSESFIERRRGVATGIREGMLRLTWLLPLAIVLIDIPCPLISLL